MLGMERDLSWPFIRYETTTQQLIDNLAPVLPNEMGAEFYTYALQNPEYMQTERGLPTTSTRWQVENLMSTDRSNLWTFWSSTLNRGEYAFTAIDHRKRCLFDASWNWKERWKKQRGGVSDIVMDMESSYPWTSSLFALYGSTANNMSDHLLDTNSDLSLSSGTMQNNAGDGNVLRLNGYALRIAENAGAQYGAGNTSLAWFQGKNNSSVSLYCQGRVANMQAAKEIDYIKLTDGANILRVFADRNAADKINVKMEWTKSGSAAETITISALDVDTWYDLCLTFDGINNEYHGYFKASADTADNWASTDEFLNGLTTLTDGIVSDTTPTNYPTNITWTSLYLLNTSGGDIFVNDADYAYVQNVFIVDDFLSPLEFNILRRLSYLWNSKTSGTWPK